MGYSKNRRAASDAPETLQSNLTAALEGPIQPPECTVLPKAAMKFWEPIIRTRPPQHWTESDLICAAHLAGVMLEIERYQAQARKTSLFYTNANGDPKVHPVHGILKDLRQQELAMCRQLQLHPTATTGRSRDQQKANQKHREARKVAEKIQQDSDRGLIGGLH